MGKGGGGVCMCMCIYVGCFCGEGDCSQEWLVEEGYVVVKIILALSLVIVQTSAR